MDFFILKYSKMKECKDIRSDKGTNIEIIIRVDNI